MTTPSIDDALVVRFQRQLDAIDDAIDAIIADRAESATFEGNTINRISLEKLERERGIINARLLRRVAQLQGRSLNFGMTVTTTPSRAVAESQETAGG